MLLLDPDVMVDILRKHQPAVDWLASLGSQPIGIPGLVAMELIQGCRDRQEQLRVEAILISYPLHWPGEEDCSRALNDFASFHLSHNLGILDTLIAHTAVGLGVHLATFNEKHYSVMRELQAMQPYSR